MLPLFEMMLRAQNGAAMESMSQQFNLAQEQVAQAMAALMPAFSSGLKRSTANPYDLTALMNAMASGNYAKYFEDLSKAFTPQGIADGNLMLERLFGSKDVSRAVAAQAAQLTGLTQEVLKQMLPAMANTLMGGLLKQSMGQIPQNGDFFAGTPMGAMMQQWLENTGLKPKPQPPTPNPFDNPFMQAMLGMQPAQKPAPETADPFAINPFMKAFQDMMKPGAEQQAAPAAKPGNGTSESNPYTEMVNSMFDTGLEVQKSYQKSMEAIFDNYLRNGQQEENDVPAPEDDEDGPLTSGK